MGFAFTSRQSAPKDDDLYEKILLEDYKRGNSVEDEYQKQQQTTADARDTFVAKTVVDMLPHISRNPEMLRSMTQHPDWATQTYPTLQRQGLGALFGQDPAGNWQVNYQKEATKKSRTFDDFLIEQAQTMFPAPGPDDITPGNVSRESVVGKVLSKQANYVAGKKAQAGIYSAEAKQDIPTQSNIEAISDDMAGLEEQARANAEDDPEVLDFMRRLGRIPRTDPNRTALSAQLQEIIKGKTEAETDRLTGQMYRRRKQATSIAKNQSPF